MNPHKYDPSDFTDYAMGEATPAQAARVRKELENNPESQVEFERTLSLVEALQQAPLLPKRSLHPRQRETVLALSKKVHPFKLAAREPKGPSIVWQICKYAAAACLLGGAFVLGQHLRTAPQAGTNEVVTLSSSSQPAVSTPAQNAEQNSSDTSDELPLVSMPSEEGMQGNFDAVAESSMLPELLPQIPEVVVTSPTPPVQSSKPTESQVASVAPAASNSGVKQPSEVPAPVVSTAGFEIVSRNPQTHITLNPNLLRPKPAPAADAIFAVIPLPGKSTPPAVKPRNKTEQQPPLMIRSWKAEIASCPWNSSRRLVRLVAQVPVDQPAIDSNEADYQLEAKFDPRMVQAYRLVAEKHLAPSRGATQATQFAWFEIIPTRNFLASQEKPAVIGSIDVVQPRGSRKMEPLELKIIDRGTQWEDAREDFIFETAMVGFGLLLEGTGNTGNLNHDLVLAIAERTKGNDPKGERSQFIEVIKQAQTAAGLNND